MKLWCMKQESRRSACLALFISLSTEFSYPCPLNFHILVHWNGYFGRLVGPSDFQSTQLIFGVIQLLIFSVQIKVCQQAPRRTTFLPYLNSLLRNSLLRFTGIKVIIKKEEYLCLFSVRIPIKCLEHSKWKKKIISTLPLLDTWSEQQWGGSWTLENRNVIKNPVNYLCAQSQSPTLSPTAFEMFHNLSGNANRNDGRDVF